MEKNLYSFTKDKFECFQWVETYWDILDSQKFEVLNRPFFWDSFVVIFREKNSWDVFKVWFGLQNTEPYYAQIKSVIRYDWENTEIFLYKENTKRRRLEELFELLEYGHISDVDALSEDQFCIKDMYLPEFKNAIEQWIVEIYTYSIGDWIWLLFVWEYEFPAVTKFGDNSSFVGKFKFWPLSQFWDNCVLPKGWYYEYACKFGKYTRFWTKSIIWTFEWETRIGDWSFIADHSHIRGFLKSLWTLEMWSCCKVDSKNIFEWVAIFGEACVLWDENEFRNGAVFGDWVETKWRLLFKNWGSIKYWQWVKHVHRHPPEYDESYPKWQIWINKLWYKSR